MLEKYLRDISKELKVSRKMKKQVVSDLEVHILQRNTHGESIEDIISEMGSATDVANDFNESFKEDGSLIDSEIAIRIAVQIVGIALLLSAIYNLTSLLFPALSLKNVLMELNGSGNVATFVAFKLSIKDILVKVIVEIILVIACVKIACATKK